MKKYNLGDIGEFKGGISQLKKEKYGSGINFINYMDIFKNPSIKNNFVLNLYDASIQDIKKYGVKYGDAFFTASSESREEIAVSSVYLSNRQAIFNGFSKRYRYDTNILKPKYAVYLFRSKKIRIQMKKFATGFTRFNISQQDLKKVKVFLPNINIQKQIIDIIEPVEKIFLKYSNCVRINNVQNTKSDIKALIDIIEPLEKMINVLEKIIKILEKMNFIRTNKKICDIADWTSNGHAYKKIDKISNGNYKIFTIKNIIGNKCERTNIENNNILKIGDVITGLSGTIGTAKIIVSDSWVSNQRTLSIRSKLSLDVLISIRNGINILNKIETGAVQKNIRSKDIMNLPLLELNSSSYSELYINISRSKNCLKSILEKVINLLIK